MTRLTRKEASAYLKEKFNLSRTPQYLARLIVTGGGPKVQYAGKKPYYPVEELDKWAEGLFGELQ